MTSNDWSGIGVPPPLGGWHPELTVSVLIPAYANQAHLDLTLAALAAQTYPAELLEVIVVDDGSPTPLRLPALRPEHTRLIRAPGEGWGPGYAVSVGANEATGAILHRVDADMLLFPDHVEALARWHHLVPYAVTLGMKRFADVPPSSLSPEQVRAGVTGLFTDDGTEPHGYLEDLFRRTRDLRDAGPTAFLAHVGATTAVSRTLYDAAGGYDGSLHLGEDTEFGYRLAQAGALFIPDRAARSWHVGPTAMSRRGDGLRRYNRPFLADRMPQPRWLRSNGGPTWTTPLVVAVVDVAGHDLETVRACVDGLLRGDERDLRVVLAGSAEPADQRRDVLDDPLLDQRLIQETYRGEPRVRLADSVESVFPSPFLLRVPAYARLAPGTVPMLLAEADRHEAAVVTAGPVTLSRTASVARTRFGAPAPPHRTVGSAGIVDLRTLPPEVLADLSGDAHPGPEAGRWTPLTVEVGGVRTLLRAAAVVAKLSATRAARRLSAATRRRKGTPHG
ncbi:MAG: glycosyltransferase family 2 protein [Hamadaea sp.]|nr:glycosyltransferase family 2 protein [Hamadaea sp.]NUR50251.1 glycosyltransferase family 2 protein [Hamadaea sp.]